MVGDCGGFGLRNKFGPHSAKADEVVDDDLPYPCHLRIASDTPEDVANHAVVAVDAEDAASRDGTIHTGHTASGNKTNGVNLHAHKPDDGLNIFLGRNVVNETFILLERAVVDRSSKYRSNGRISEGGARKGRLVRTGAKATVAAALMRAFGLTFQTPHAGTRMTLV